MWRALVTLMLLGVCACSTLPTPRDVTGLSSAQITQFVRCEMSNAVRNKLIVLMTEFRSVNANRYFRTYDGKDIESELALLKSEPDEFRKLDWDKFDKGTAKGLKYFAMVTVGYDFTLEGAHDGTVSANLDLVGKFRKRTTILNNTVSIQVTRDNKDHFRIYDSFDVLIRSIGKEECSGTPEIPNPVYPIAGLIAFDDLIEHFFYAAQYQNMGSLGKSEGDFTPVKTIADAEETRTIVFTTKAIAKIDPTTTLNPVHHVFAFAPLALSVDNIRTDTHTVIINIKQQENAKNAPYFDRYGRLNIPPPTIAAVSAALDRAISKNQADSINTISRTLSRGEF